MTSKACLACHYCYYEEQCHIVDEGMKIANTKQAFQVVQKLRKTLTPKLHNIQDEKGRLLTDLL